MDLTITNLFFDIPVQDTDDFVYPARLCRQDGSLVPEFIRHRMYVASVALEYDEWI